MGLGSRGHWVKKAPDPGSGSATLFGAQCFSIKYILQPPFEKFRSYAYLGIYVMQEVTKRCRLSWLTNSPLVYEPKCGGEGVSGSLPKCTADQLYTEKI
jgi:hypothetical protein